MFYSTKEISEEDAFLLGAYSFPNQYGWAQLVKDEFLEFNLLHCFSWTVSDYGMTGTLLRNQLKRNKNIMLSYIRGRCSGYSISIEDRKLSIHYANCIEDRDLAVEFIKKILSEDFAGRKLWNISVESIPSCPGCNSIILEADNDLIEYFTGKNHPSLLLKSKILEIIREEQRPGGALSK